MRLPFALSIADLQSSSCFSKLPPTLMWDCHPSLFCFRLPPILLSYIRLPTKYLLFSRFPPILFIYLRLPPLYILFIQNCLPISLVIYDCHPSISCLFKIASQSGWLCKIWTRFIRLMHDCHPISLFMWNCQPSLSCFYKMASQFLCFREIVPL